MSFPLRPLLRLATCRPGDLHILGAGTHAHTNLFTRHSQIQSPTRALFDPALTEPLPPFPNPVHQHYHTLAQATPNRARLFLATRLRLARYLCLVNPLWEREGDPISSLTPASPHSFSPGPFTPSRCRQLTILLSIDSVMKVDQSAGIA